MARSTKELYELFIGFLERGSTAPGSCDSIGAHDLSARAHDLFAQIAPTDETEFPSGIGKDCHNGEEFVRFLGMFLAYEIHEMLAPLGEQLEKTKAFDPTGTEVSLPDHARAEIVRELQKTAVSAALKGFLETATDLGIINSSMTETDLAVLFSRMRRNLN